jgi:hypothetical protein
MKRTMHLRFVERQIPIEEVGGRTLSRSVRVLQQFFEFVDGQQTVLTVHEHLVGDWFDVPLVGEQQ